MTFGICMFEYIYIIVLTTFDKTNNLHSHFRQTPKIALMMRPASFCLLLTGGTVITHDDQDRPSASKADVLIQGDRIAEIGPQISPNTCKRVINCADKIISPGFIDTHHHVWETALKGLFADLSFFPYLAKS